MEPASQDKDASWLKKLGPGLITGAADDDPSGIATYSQAGAISTIAAAFDAAQTQLTATQSIATIVNYLSCNLDTNQEAKGASTL